MYLFLLQPVSAKSVAQVLACRLSACTSSGEGFGGSVVSGGACASVVVSGETLGSVAPSSLSPPHPATRSAMIAARAIRVIRTSRHTTPRPPPHQHVPRASGDVYYRFATHLGCLGTLEEHQRAVCRAFLRERRDPNARPPAGQAGVHVHAGARNWRRSDCKCKHSASIAPPQRCHRVPPKRNGCGRIWLGI